MKDMKEEMLKELKDTLMTQEFNYDQLEELEEIVTPVSGCACATGGFC
jgi:hypothetical protein